MKFLLAALHLIRGHPAARRQPDEHDAVRHRRHHHRLRRWCTCGSTCCCSDAGTQRGDVRLRRWSPRCSPGEKYLPDEIAVIPPWASVLTSMFMHGGFWHLAGNMLYLWIFGNNLEDAMGHVRYFLFYVLCGVAAVFAQVLPNPGFGNADGGRQRRHLRRARRLPAAVSPRPRVVRVAARLHHRRTRTIPGYLGAGGVVRHATRPGRPRGDSARPANPRVASPSARTSADSSRDSRSSHFSNDATFRCGGATETLLHSAHIARPDLSGSEDLGS